jgi:hypothetical protein
MARAMLEEREASTCYGKGAEKMRARKAIALYQRYLAIVG